MRRGLFSLVAGKRALGLGGQPRILLYASEAKRIARYARSSPSLEIGGDLFGFYEPGGNPLIFVASGPGPGARRDATHFQQDLEFQAAVFNELATKFRMFYVGDWHSHHSLNLSEPSPSDNAKLQDLANKNGWRQLFSFIVQTEISSSRSRAARSDEPELDGPVEAYGIWWNAFQYVFQAHDLARYRVSIDFQSGANPYEATSENIDGTLKVEPRQQVHAASGLASAVLPPLESLSRNHYEVGSDDLLNTYQDICRSLSRELDEAEMEVDLESLAGPRLVVFDGAEKVTCSMLRRSSSAYDVVIDPDGGKQVKLEVPSDHGKISPAEVRRISACVASQFKTSGDRKQTRRKGV
jgi:hypothetical protein